MDARITSGRDNEAINLDFSLMRFPSTSTNSTASNLPGPGRTIGVFYSFVGRHIENQLGRLAEKLGKGPRITAVRIRRHRAMTLRFPSGDSKEITKCNAKAGKDCKKLLEYVASHVGSTQVQALNEITCLVVEDEFVQEVLLAMDAERVIGSLQIWDFRRRTNFSSSLLSSSRKALSSLADTEINSLAKEMEAKMLSQREWPHMELSRFKNYLNEPERAFLVIRHLQRFLDKPISHDYIISHIFKVDGTINFDVVSCSLEWPGIDLLVSKYYRFFLRYSSTAWRLPSHCLASLLEFVLRHPDKLPEAISSEFFSWFASSDTANNSINKFHIYLSWCLLHGIAVANNLHEVLQVNLDLLQHAYPHPSVKTILHRISGAPELLLHSIISARYGRFGRGTPEYLVYDIPRVVNPEELESSCNQLSQIIDSGDVWMRERALHAFKYLLTVDIYCHRGSRPALMKARFARTEECARLIEDSKTSCAPIKELRYSRSRQVLRHCDADGYLLHMCVPEILCGQSLGHCCDVLEGTKKVLEYKSQDVLELHLARGIAFRTAGHHAILAGVATEGKQVYLARPVSKKNHEGDYVAITEGTKPEDLRMLEYQCVPGKAKMVVPLYLVIYVLRYEPETYLRCGRLVRLSSDKESGFDTTTIFSWKPWITTSEAMSLHVTIQEPRKNEMQGTAVPEECDGSGNGSGEKGVICVGDKDSETIDEDWATARESFYE